MATEIGNQLLARVRDEMGRNIATIKRQLIEWLERPESGGIEILRDKLAEISGGLSLIGQDEAVALADAIIAGVTDLSQGVAQHGVDAAFPGYGAELAAGLLVLTDYIERLDHLSEHNRQAVIQATEAVKSITAADKGTVHVAAQPFISKETYQALAAKINEIIETSRNQIEEYIRNPEAPFNTTTIIEANKNLISFFAVLELKTPQALLQQINQQISAQLSEQQWIDIAEAMILVQESLKHAEHDETIRQTDNFRDAVQAQAAHSRLLEVEKLIHDTGKLGRRFFEALRKEVLHAETIKQEQPWREATTQLVHYSAITALAGLKELAAQLQHFGLLCAEFTLQKDETLAKTYASVIDALVAVEYLFNDLAETGKISLHDVGFLAEAVGNIDKVCPVSAQAKNLFVQLANMAPPDDGEEEGSGDIEEFKDVLESALDVLDDDFSMLEELEEEEEPELPSVMLAGTHAGSGAPATAAAGLAQLEHSDSAAAIPVNQNAAGVGINAPLAGQGAAEQAGGAETAATPAAEIPPSRATATAAAEIPPSGATATAAAEIPPSRVTATVESAPSEAARGAATETAPSEMTMAPVAEIVTAPSETTVAPVAETAPSEAPSASGSGQQAAVAASGALPAVAYFASKSLDDLQTMDVPAEKVSFVGSHADAVMDEEIREFFNEELAEIVATMNDVYPQWREASDDARLTGDIRRAFHTLKGSGRTVGYESLGEFAWQHEQLLNRVIEKDYPANSLVRDTVGDAISLLNVLHQGEEFVEHKGALLQQALVAERVRLSLLDAPQSEQDALDALSRKLRLSDGGDVPSGEPVNAVAVTTTPASETADDWAAFDDIALDTPTSDEPPTITLAEDDFSVEKERISPEETASATTTHHDGAGIDFAPADEHTATTSHDTVADGEHGGMDFAFAEDDTSHAAAHTATARHDATADGEHSGVDFAFVEDGGSHAAAHTATDRNDAAADGEHGGMDFAFVEDDVSHAAAHTATARHDAAADGEHGGIDFAFVEDDANHAAGQTVAASVHHAAQHDDTVAMDFALSDSHATSDITSATPAEEIKAVDVSGSESYDKALRTLQRGLRMGEPDADMQAALAETIRRQWQQSMMDDPAMRAAMTQSLIESFKGDSVGQAQWVSDILAQANAAGNASVPVQPGLVPQMAGAPVHVAPSGISQEAYDRMLTTLRRGLAAGADEDMQAVLSDTISRQWLQQGIDTEGETRDAIISQLKASLLEEGVADEAVLDAMLETVPHRVPSVLPEGVRQDSYGIMMETLRAGLSNASSADVQEMLATAIGNQWQNQNSLQDSAIRAAVAEQMAAVLGGNGQENSALVEAVLNRAAEKAREIPTGIRPDDYHNMLDTLRSNISNAQSDEAQDALAASISAHWQEQSLQDEATRDAVAQRIIAALGGKTETDSAAVEAVLNRVAEKMAQQQAAAAPSETTAGFTAAHGAGVQLTPSEITADSADEQAASISLAPSEHPAGDAVRGVAIEATILPQGVRQESYGAMLQTLQAGINAVQGDSVAQEALAASIGAQWQEAHTLQDPVARAAVAQQISAALGDQADTATVEAVLNRAAAQVGELPQGVEQAAYGAMLQTLQAGISAAQGDSAAQETLAAGIAAQWQEAHTLQDPVARAAVAQQISAALGDQADTATVEAVLNRAAAQVGELPQGVEQAAYGAMLQTLQAGISAAQGDSAAQETLAAGIAAQWQSAESLQDPAVRATVAQQISAALGDSADTATVEAVLNRAAAQAIGLPQGVEQTSYSTMLQTLQAGIGAAQDDAVAQEALAASIGAQWQTADTLHDPAARATVAQQISAALGDKADTASIEHILERAAVQAGFLPPGVRQDAYGSMLQTLQAGIGIAQSDTAAQEMLAATVGAQWQEPQSLQDDAARITVAAQIAAALGDKADVADVEAVLNRAAHQAAELPQGVRQEAYGRMLHSMRFGEIHGEGIEQEMLAAAVGAQWEEPYSLQDAATRASVAQQLATALGGVADTAAVSAILDRAAHQAAQLPAGVNQDGYGAILQALRSHLDADVSDATTQEVLAATIGSQWQDAHSLQDDAARAAFAQQISAAFDGAMEETAVVAVLDRAAAQAAQLPQDVHQSAYGAVLQKLHTDIGEARDNPAAQEALAAAIGARWREEHTLQDPVARATVAQQLTAALGDAADAATVEAVLNRAAAQAGFLPPDVRQEAYGDILHTLHAGIGAGQDDAVAAEALAASIGAQWQEAHTLHDPATRAAVAQQLTAALGDKADAANIEAVLNRAAAQAGELPQGVKQGAYGAMLQTLQAGIGAAKDDAVAQEALAASISTQWQEQHTLQDPAIRAAMAQKLSDSLGGEVDAATVAAILEHAAVKAADDAAQPDSLSADSYNHLLSLLRRGLKDGDADTQAALAATLQRQWQKQALPQDAAAVDAVQQQLAADGIDGAQLAQIFSAAGLHGSGQPSGEVVVKAVLSQDSADAAAAVDAPVVKAAASEHMHDDFVDMAAENTPAAEPATTFVDAAVDAHNDHTHVAADFLDVAADSHSAADAEIYPTADADEATSDFIDTAGVPGDVEPLPEEDELPVLLGGMAATTIDSQGKGGPAISATPTSVVQIAPSRGMSPAERLNRELASLAQHPGLDGAVQGAKAGEGSATNNRAGFLRAVDQFDTLSQLADKNESPEIIDDLIDAVYDIEDSIDSEVAPPWIWRLLDSIEQLLLTHKQEGTPVSLSSASVLRQSARLIENFEEDANEEDAIEAINALLNARREAGGGKSSSEPTALPYSGDPLGSELVEDPNANTMLAETFIDEAMSLFAHSQEEAERWDENRDQLSRLDAIRRDMHTLKGSARMAGYNAIGDLTHGVESLIDGIVSGQAEASSKATSILVGAMWQGMLMLDTVRDGYLPQTDPYILNNIHSYLNQPLPYPEVAEAAEVARQEAREEAAAAAAAQAARIEVKDLTPEPAEETPVEEVAVVTEFDDNIDPVLVDIFTDEAQELLQTTSQLLEDDFSKSEVVEELQRTMHTLKGGARLVGFTAIGDTAHLMESVIDKIPDLAEGKVRQAKTLLHFGLDAHYEMLDSVMRHEMPQPALEVNESLKVFADSGQYRVPSQGKGRAGADEGTPDEQATADNVPSEAPGEPAGVDSKGGQTPSESAADTGAAGSAKGEGASHSEPARAGSHSSGGHTDEAAASTAPSSATPAPAHSDKAHDDSKAADKAPVAQADKHDTPPDHTPDLEKERGSDISGVPEAKADKPETAKDKEKDSKDSTSGDNLPRYVRVDAQLLDEMIAMTGETAIMRSRMENIISEAEFNLTELTRVATRIAEQMRRLDSETEAQMLYRREQQGEDDLHFDPLEMDRFSEIQQLSRQLSEAIDDLKNLQDTLSQDNTTLRNLSIQQGIIQRGIQDHLLTTQLMRFDVHEARLRRLVRQTAKSVGKDVNFILEGGEVEVERRLLEDILPALEHMIRNSLAHGIETPESRLATGKSETGTIKVKVGVHAAELSVDVLDDGQGLNYERIRDKAAAKGMLDPERADDESYLSSLILRSGFSTAESLSQLAGRGVGMDVVNEMVKQRRGQIVVRSKRGEGTMFTLNMPFSMSIAEVLLVEIAGQTFAAPMSSIKAIGQVSHNILQRSVDGEIVYQNYEDKDYRQFVLGAYFRPDQYTLSDEEAGAPVLFINSEDNPVAFHVDRILNRLEIIVKNVNRQVLNIPGISGATILGDGRVVPVLELLDLSRRIADLTTLHAQRAAEVEVTVPNILVVDDSVTMRKVSTRLLERHHYNVATAKDGLDAIEVLNSFTPDVILLDIEMPRMDGFEFASHVRHGSNVPDVPIVMITSRTGDKHRERADAIGVQGYLGKPYSEDMLIQTLEFLLKKGGDN
ncbi:Hpt domain-containing protein [Cardiobacterium sp. Marseille-Q4385]|uniref:Hpt domain-containing protein n=1 Tax=Cardiobacterium sp. Marseille-Q4385 TaxID=2866573 RepID=UPI001CE4143E|nr:Hpt domain-containing protein [Cardiobacterium sp. Marseille-Q4385]